MSYLLDAVNWPQIWVITAVGYSVVFTALILLIFVFKFMPKVLNMQLKRRLKKEGKYVERTEGDEPFIAGEVNAAIGTALSLYFSDLHDDESKIITIKRVEKDTLHGARKFTTLTMCCQLPTGRMIAFA